jgi:hypothetical protein
MFSDKEEKAFKVVDDFLIKLQTSCNGEWFKTYGKPPEFFLAKQLMEKYNLITYRAPGSKESLSDISPDGLMIINNGGLRNYLISLGHSKEERENLELQQLRTNVQVLSNQHLDYEKDRKRFIRNELALWLSILLSIVAIVISIMKGN